MSVARPWIDVTALGLVLGFVADRLLGDPTRHHPVAWFGSYAAAVERVTLQVGSPRVGRKVKRCSGIGAHLLALAPVVSAGMAVRHLVARRPMARVAATAASTWVVLGGRTLEREAEAVAELARSGDLPAARWRIRSLVGRDATALDADELARACVESVAENGSDAVVAPLVWGAIGGIPGLLGYRAVNTLDAMWGHRSPRYEDVGWWAARVDDAANAIPARLTALITVGWAAAAGRGAAAWQAWRQDAPAHPSPNAGPVEATFAGALGRSLGGANVYGGVVEDRGRLGSGPPVVLADVDDALLLARRVQWSALILVVAARAMWPRHTEH